MSNINISLGLKFFYPEDYKGSLDDTTYNRFMAAQGTIQNINWITEVMYKKATKEMATFCLQESFLMILTLRRYFENEGLSFKITHYEYNYFDVELKWIHNINCKPLKVIKEKV